MSVPRPWNKLGGRVQELLEKYETAEFAMYDAFREYEDEMQRLHDESEGWTEGGGKVRTYFREWIRGGKNNLRPEQIA